MPKKKKKHTKKVKITTTKKVKSTKPKKVKAVNTQYPIDQFEDLKGWISYYEEHKKFPHDRVLCGLCHSGFASLKGLGWSKAFERCDGDAFRVLNETKCKDCRNQEPKEKKKKVLTIEEMEARAEEIRRNLPKIDLNKERQVIDLTRDKDACEFYTQFACMRPDIYLDNDRTCDYCSINKWCACPIKKFSKHYKRKNEK
jgi:hypothetical protein